MANNFMDVMSCDGLDRRLTTLEHLIKAIHIKMMAQVQPMFSICNNIYLQLIMYLLCHLLFSIVTQSITNPVHILVDEMDCSFAFARWGNPMNPKHLIQKTQFPNPVYFLLFYQ
jgi:hypothetical protein